MALLYERRIEVSVAGLDISKLRIRIRIERQIDQTQDKGRCDIFNLSQANEQRIYERGGPILIQAGYPETLATLFEGTVQRVIRAREELSKITRIALGDEVHDPERLGGIFTASYDGPIPVRQIASDIIAAMGLTPGPLDAIPADATFTNFYWGGAPADGALTVLLESIDRTWYEADGIVRINTPGGEAQADAPRIRISPETGLIAAPIATDEGAELRTFLDARIVLGSIIDLESEALSGTWKVVGIRHSAENWEASSFETFCDLRAL